MNKNLILINSALIKKYKVYFQDIWAFRYFIIGTIRRNFVIKYQDSIFGFLWAIFHPLLYIIIYTVVLEKIMSRNLDSNLIKTSYGIYIFSGMISWNLAVDILTQSIGMLNQYANIIKKTAFVKIVLPIIVIGNSIINFLIIFTLLILYCIFSTSLNINLLPYVIPIVVAQVIFLIGLGVLLSIINVFVKDISQIVQILLQILFWLTPIVYMDSDMPEYLKNIIFLNPLSYFISGMHDIFYFGRAPDLNPIIIIFALGLFICLFGFYLFNKFFSEIMDEL
jgi:lipopolysaccharide transport system permease protein